MLAQPRLHCVHLTSSLYSIALPSDITCEKAARKAWKYTICFQVSIEIPRSVSSMLKVSLFDDMAKSPMLKPTVSARFLVFIPCGLARYAVTDSILSRWREKIEKILSAMLTWKHTKEIERRATRMSMKRLSVFSWVKFAWTLMVWHLYTKCIRAKKQAEISNASWIFSNSRLDLRLRQWL